MALTCPRDFDAQRLQRELMSIYGRVALEPDGEFHFHRGPHYAAEFLGYNLDELLALPKEVTASFAGIGNPHRIGPISAGVTVLDIGCGAGMDLLLAAKKVGPTGKAIGVDMTSSMIEKARAGATAAGLSQVEIRQSEAAALPVEDNSIDIVISNGVFNLTPDKIKAFREVARVLRPDGQLYLADIIIGTELSEPVRKDIDLWTG
ncbi:MAG TPA: methyltransferase domain-containing protein [Candidatus Binatia bacterium]|nr:methyltransferase domain-containing protein [Candidatus Binatia bacterium]